MPEPVTVDAGDVRCVSGVLTLAAQAFGSYLGQVPGFGDALEACGRLCAAAQSLQMPQDPVAGTDQLAITHREFMAAYERHEFTREEAFSMLQIYVAATANAASLRGLAGG